jgi:hypothetical protein
MGKKMKAISLLLLLIAAAPTFAESPNEKWEALIAHTITNRGAESPEGVKEILKELEISGTQIDLKDFEEVEIKELKKRIPQDYLIHSLGDDPMISDSFSYAIIKESGSESFWILKKGGFAGVFKLYRRRPIQSELSTPLRAPRSTP